jgi:hypothetical protein
MIRLPADEGQLRSMLAEGLLDEGHALELKRELPPGTAANKELARDLGQFTIDGGVLIYGVDEGDETTPPSLTPVDLADLPERIEGVAANRVDPPLHVRIQPIPAAGQPGKGYLLVIVPPTPNMIHMVGGRYWARGEKTRYALSDAEVQRYHQLALKGQRDAADLLDAEVGRDPAAAAGLTAHAHLFGITQPVGARSDLLERVIGGSGPKGWHDFLYELVGGTAAGQPLGPDWSPDIKNLGEPTRRADSWALSSARVRPGRTVEVPGLDPIVSGIDVEKDLLDLEVNEDGGLRMFCGGASHTMRNVDYVNDGLVIGLTKHLVMISETIATTTDWLGNWDFGIAVTGLRGLVSASLLRHGQDWLVTPYSKEEYRETVRATYERIVKDPDSIVADLTGRLNRGLGGSAPIPRAFG